MRHRPFFNSEVETESVSTPHTRFLRAMLERAILDLYGNHGQGLRDDAARWLEGGGGKISFETVCQGLNFDRKATLLKIKAMK